MLHSSFEAPKRLGDVLKSEGNPIVTRESKTMTNPHSEAVTFPAGYPMDDNVPVAAAALAGVDGMLLTPITLAANGEEGDTAKVAVLARGPAAYDVDALPAVDYAGASFNMTTLAGKYNALVLVVPREEPETVELQET